MKPTFGFPKPAKQNVLTTIAGFALGIFIFFVTTALVFHLTCLPAFSAQVTLAWDAPTTYSDGTPAEVGGYKVYMGTATGSYSPPVDAGMDTSYLVSNLSEGDTYYFTVTALDKEGNESGYSNEVSTTIPVHYSITATSDSYGTIIPSGNPPVSQATNGSSVIKLVTVNQGATQSFTIAPNSGYRIDDVVVDGVSAGAVSTYTFSSVTVNHSISATFAVVTYKVSQPILVPVSEESEIDGNVTAGQTVSSTTTATTGKVSATAAKGGIVAADQTISPASAITSYNVSTNSSGGGSISPTGISKVNFGIVKQRQYSLLQFIKRAVISGLKGMAGDFRR